MQIQQHAVFKHSSFYLLYELHPHIPENASEKVREEAVADAAGTAVADTAGTAVADAAGTAVADTAVADAESRLKEISHAHAKANQLLLNQAIQSKRIQDSLVKKSSLKMRI
ncbi:uncharacterized protein BDCG_17758 [Blastomyces dermatitidis ER-3]|uniref:Uncharacterized protein n=1 Tax=Ajellomyces dermatitidis (strain ER-3 / ATCC MYA-2586) TaxID=559297 RepID=A0ABX2W0U2_AJEDR|nr:uncharacterized protein BDCG_17758 [Blastomyces dermatitidis ER-3]OAT02763.1 hypothetical protein BDCG_17758 [Blastomyces dermatitidis ER-3]